MHRTGEFVFAVVAETTNSFRDDPLKQRLTNSMSIFSSDWRLCACLTNLGGRSNIASVSDDQLCSLCALSVCVAVKCGRLQTVTSCARVQNIPSKGDVDHHYPPSRAVKKCAMNINHARSMGLELWPT